MSRNVNAHSNSVRGNRNTQRVLRRAYAEHDVGVAVPKHGEVDFHRAVVRGFVRLDALDLRRLRPERKRLETQRGEERRPRRGEDGVQRLDDHVGRRDVQVRPRRRQNFAHPAAALDVAERQPRGKLPDQVLDLGLVQRAEVRQRGAAGGARVLLGLQTHPVPRTRGREAHLAPKPTTAAPNSPRRGLMKFLAAAARSSGKVNALVEGGSTSAGLARPGAANVLRRLVSFRKGGRRGEDRRGRTRHNRGRSRKKRRDIARAPRRLSSSSTSSSRRSRTTTTTTLSRCSFVFAFRRVPSSRRSSSPDATAGSAAAPETRTADATHANAAARAKRPRLRDRPPDVAPPRRVSSPSRLRARGNRAATRDATRRRGATRRAPRRARARGVQRTPPSRARRGGRCGRPLLPRVTLCAHSPLRPRCRGKKRESRKGDFFLLPFFFSLRPSAEALEKLTRVGKYPSAERGRNIQLPHV